MGPSRMGNKSKFTFPVPGRSTKPPPQMPNLSIATPLTKAQKILGTGTIGIDASPISKEPGRSWETGSNSGISISISESTASHSTMDTGFGVTDEDEASGTSRSRGMWEQESEIIPRQIASTHSHRARLKGLMDKKSSAAISGDYQDATTDDSSPPRRGSNSTIWTHYEPSKMPLSISQQTSSSAMAKGPPPSKVNSLLNADGDYLNAKKKKPGRLDFSMLRSRSRNRKDQSTSTLAPGPILGNNYITKSPSFISQSPLGSTSAYDLNQKPPRKASQKASSTLDVRAIGSSHSAGHQDTSGLQQLYDHYEKMSFGDGSAMDEEGEDEGDAHPQYLEPRTYSPGASTPDLMPLSYPTVRDQGSQWKHSRTDTQDSRVTAIRSDTPNTLQMYKKDYPTSVSSRHTRTSKASPSTRSIVESDRQQNSVLSLTDSESEDELLSSASVRSPPYHENTSRDDLSISSDPRQFSTARRPTAPSHRTSSTRSSTYGQLNEYLAIPRSSSLSQTTRSVPNTTSQPHQPSSSAIVSQHAQPAPTQAPDIRSSIRSAETVRSGSSAGDYRQSGYSIKEARAIALKPLASTAEAASSVPVPGTPTSLDFGHSTRNPSHRISSNSHVSDQPTPPLSPNSVEFYMRSPESIRKESIASESSSVNNARFMAVTKQEEMLLAALRMKRAKMRETIISEDGEDGGRPASASSSLSGNRKVSAERHSITGLREGMDSRASSRSHALPSRNSMRDPSVERGNHRYSQQASYSKGARITDTRPSTTRSSPASKSRSSMLAAAPTSSPRSQPASKPRHERILLYLDEPVDHLNSIDTTEPSPDPSELMDSDQEYLPGDRRSKAQTARSSISSIYAHYSSSNSRRASGQPRPDSSPMSTGRSSSPLRIMNSLEDVPEVPLEQLEEEEADFDETDAEEDDIDLDDFPAVIRQPLSQEKETPRPDSAARCGSAADGLLHPSSAGHIRNKQSDVRLSAVGVASPIPWWGDDD
ncbi:hypothetical protein F5X96DRAFT_668632 [Biscogniauxia mediterranea]|nr:hypothetical protein F5X96DRAFT_668632 [Biscogniauxia mediterranea]